MDFFVANDIIANAPETINLVNKIVLSIAIRLKAEMSMEQRLLSK